MYLNEGQSSASVFRFDVVSVTFALDESAPEIMHVEDAFQAGFRLSGSDSRHGDRWCLNGGLTALALDSGGLSLKIA